MKKKQKKSNSSKRIRFLTAYSLVLILVFDLAVFRTFATNVIFRLVGGLTLEVDQEYDEPGFFASVLGQDLTDKVVVSGEVDTTKLGTYELEYKLDFLGKTHTLSRKVEVVDNTPPEISLNGDAEVKLYVGDEYTEEGGIANDNYDGDLTEKIEISGEVDVKTAGEYEITYSVEDSSNNISSISRKIKVEKKPVVVKYAPTATVPAISREEITAYLSEKGYNISVGYYNLVTGASYYYNEGKLYYGASLIKTLDAVYVYEHNMVSDEVRENARKAITVSDNDAHFALIDLIGRENLKNYGLGLGAAHTLGYGSFGDTTVTDQMVYMRKLSSVASGSAELRSFFLNNNNNYIKVAGISTMHKYGTYGQYYHDAGIVLDSQPYILVVLTEHGAGGRAIIREVSGLIYRLHKNS